MMRLLLLLAICLPLAVQAGDDAQPAPKPAAKSATQLPEGAKRVKPFLYRYEDTDGKVWMYRKTPFGYIRYEEQNQNAASPASGKSASDGIAAFDEGEYVRFERKGPLGKSSWVRKKTELTESEKKAWERAQAEQASKKASDAEAKKE